MARGGGLLGLMFVVLLASGAGCTSGSSSPDGGACGAARLEIWFDPAEPASTSLALNVLAVNAAGSQIVLSSFDATFCAPFSPIQDDGGPGHCSAVFELPPISAEAYFVFIVRPNDGETQPLVRAHLRTRSADGGAMCDRTVSARYAPASSLADAGVDGAVALDGPDVATTGVLDAMQSIDATVRDTNADADAGSDAGDSGVQAELDR